MIQLEAFARKNVTEDPYDKIRVLTIVGQRTKVMDFNLSLISS